MGERETSTECLCVCSDITCTIAAQLCGMRFGIASKNVLPLEKSERDGKCLKTSLLHLFKIHLFSLYTIIICQEQMKNQINARVSHGCAQVIGEKRKSGVGEGVIHRNATLLNTSGNIAEREREKTNELSLLQHVKIYADCNIQNGIFALYEKCKIPTIKMNVHVYQGNCCCWLYSITTTFSHCVAFPCFVLYCIVLFNFVNLNGKCKSKYESEQLLSRWKFFHFEI